MGWSWVIVSLFSPADSAIGSVIVLLDAGISTACVRELALVFTLTWLGLLDVFEKEIVKL